MILICINNENILKETETDIPVPEPEPEPSWNEGSYYDIFGPGFPDGIKTGIEI